MITRKQEAKRKATLTLAYHDFAKGMRTHSFFKVNNRATSDDLVQDTFIKTWRYLARGGKIDLMKAFLYHILNQLIIDEYRKRKTTSLDTLIDQGYEPSVNYSEQIVNTLDGQAAISLIQYLPVKYRTVIQLRYVQDLSLKEIALLTGQSRNAVAVQTHRGLKKLKVLYHRKKIK